MTTPIEALERDHRNMKRLLALIEDQVDGFHRGTPLDFDLLRSVMDYIRNFPDRFHHPREDLIFRRLALRQPAAAGGGDLLEEHRLLAELAARLAEAIGNVELEIDLPRAALEGAARAYVAACRHHMAEEERVLFPLAQQRLTDADWAEIAKAPSAPADPLFGGEVEQRYLRLHERIMRLGA